VAETDPLPDGLTCHTVLSDLPYSCSTTGGDLTSTPSGGAAPSNSPARYGLGHNSRTRFKSSPFSTRRVDVGLFTGSAPRGQAPALKGVPYAIILPKVKSAKRSPQKALKHQQFEGREDSAEAITVLIAAYDSLFREGLRLFLSSHKDIRVIGEAADGVQAMGIVDTLRPDILLLGGQMLKESGLKLLPAFRSKSPKTKVLIFSGRLEDAFIAEALLHGAMGYLLTTSTQKDLIKAIRATCAGEIWAERKVLTQVLEDMRRRINELQDQPLERGEHLTEREREIVQCVTHGMTNKEIASRLGISEKTVKTHLHSTFAKLKVNRRVQLFRAPSNFP
jgi:two-component system, NarL family, response regulator LiaR